jgi:hypothetical protein
MGGCTQVSGSFSQKDIFRWVCLQAGYFLNKGKDIPEYATP